eukprot:superscaffoldBa00002647_g14904
MAKGISCEVEKVGKWVRGLRPKRRQLPLQHLSLPPESSTSPLFPLWSMEEHTALAASSLSVVVPSSSLLQHLPERHQAEQDPDPSTAPSQDQSPINCLLLQAQLSSPTLPAPLSSQSPSTPPIPIHFPLPSHNYSPPALSPFKALSLSLLGLERGRSRSISPFVSQKPEIPARDAI